MRNQGGDEYSKGKKQTGVNTAQAHQKREDSGSFEKLTQVGER